MESNATSTENTTESDSEPEPEYVGAYSEIVSDQCTHWRGDIDGQTWQCTRDATHTIVLYDGNELLEASMCDFHGEPDDVDDRLRGWSQ